MMQKVEKRGHEATEGWNYRNGQCLNSGNTEGLEGIGNRK